jgi:ATP-binding cassette subfamily B protein
VEREAFARARQFLNYSPVAKWAALTAAVGTGVVYVALLLVLGLFADLVVYRGRIPSYRDLPPHDQRAFQDHWKRLAEPEQTLRHLGVADAVAKALANPDFEKLTSREKELLWRAYVSQNLRHRVGARAAVLVFPSHGDLPAAQQQAFPPQWQALAGKDEVLGQLELSPELAQADPAKAAPEERELLWRVYLFQRLSDEPDPWGPTVAQFFWRDRTATAEAGRGYEETAYPELADRGILGRVVRAQDRVYGPALGWVARWNPWMWQFGDVTWPTYANYLSGLWLLAVLLALLGALLKYFMSYAAAVATIEATTRLRRAVYHHTFRLGRLAFRALGPSEAASVFTRDLEAVHDALYTWLTVVFREPVKFALLLGFALLVNFWLALAFLLFALLVWYVGGGLAAYFRREGRATIRRAAEQLALLQESLMLMRLVKCYLMELFNQARVERQLKRYAGAQLRRYRGEAIYPALLVFLGTLAAVVLLYVAGLILYYQRLGLASTITLATALVSLYWPLVDWLEHRRFLRRGRQGAVTLFNFLDRPGEVGQVVGAEFLPAMNKLLEFDDVSLKEPGSERMLLQNVSLKIAAGTRVALVGSDDMEKYALVYLIPRFLDPTAGEIRIDQHNLRWVTLDSLRAQTAVVLQHNLVFNDTVANNIGCGDPSYPLPKIIEAAKVAHVHHDIQKLPRGYETVIGEMGHPLNIGEKFRIALARAILRDPALVIIEEPAVQLDEDTKDLLDDTYARFLTGRTVLFLPHRISTIRSCNRVYLIHKGRVEAAGEHRELLQHNELYQHLHYLEFNMFAGQI